MKSCFIHVKRIYMISFIFFKFLPQTVTRFFRRKKTPEKSLVLLLTLLLALISGIIFGSETIEWEQNLNFTDWATQEFSAKVDEQKVGFKVPFEPHDGAFFTEEFYTMTVASNLISTSIYGTYSTCNSRALNLSSMLATAINLSK